eukprot:Hpha_TRINITY_DN14519_c1_g2::TRINITY_DN14519_c1_g2_i1::g.47236::m.47236
MGHNKAHANAKAHAHLTKPGTMAERIENRKGGSPPLGEVEEDVGSARRRAPGGPRTVLPRGVRGAGADGRGVSDTEDVGALFELASEEVRPLDAESGRNAHRREVIDPARLPQFGDHVVEEVVAHHSVIEERLLGGHDLRVQGVVRAPDRVLQRLPDLHQVTLGPTLHSGPARPPSRLPHLAGGGGLHRGVGSEDTCEAPHCLHNHGGRVIRRGDEVVHRVGVVGLPPHLPGLRQPPGPLKYHAQAQGEGGAVEGGAGVVQVHLTDRDAPAAHPRQGTQPGGVAECGVGPYAGGVDDGDELVVGNPSVLSPVKVPTRKQTPTLGAGTPHAEGVATGAGQQAALRVTPRALRQVVDHSVDSPRDDGGQSLLQFVLQHRHDVLGVCGEIGEGVETAGYDIGGRAHPSRRPLLHALELLKELGGGVGCEKAVPEPVRNHKDRIALEGLGKYVGRETVESVGGFLPKELSVGPAHLAPGSVEVDQQHTPEGVVVTRQHSFVQSRAAALRLDIEPLGTDGGVPLQYRYTSGRRCSKHQPN